jgi:hypothetical protein
LFGVDGINKMRMHLPALMGSSGCDFQFVPSNHRWVGCPHRMLDHLTWQWLECSSRPVTDIRIHSNDTNYWIKTASKYFNATLCNQLYGNDFFLVNAES